MNMLIRYLILSLLLKNDQSHSGCDFTTPINRHYRILPHDMGFRDHIPNYRYLSFIELNLQQWFIQQNTIEGANWVISSQQMTYLKQGRLFNKISIKSQVLGWDSKYFYFRHEFLVKHTLIAVGLTKIVIMEATKVLPTSTITNKPEQLHPVIETWKANLSAIKQQTPIN